MLIGSTRVAFIIDFYKNFMRFNFKDDVDYYNKNYFMGLFSTIKNYSIKIIKYSMIFINFDFFR